eukprot:6758550-Prymnesium_polylepis.1
MSEATGAADRATACGRIGCVGEPTSQALALLTRNAPTAAIRELLEGSFVWELFHEMGLDRGHVANVDCELLVYSAKPL